MPRMGVAEIGILIDMTGAACDSQARPLRMTRQRRVIMEKFRTPGRHLTAADVYASVRGEVPNISLGTVYRNLEVLSQAGLIRKLYLGGGQRQYDGGLHRHYHIRCVRCGEVSDVSADLLPDLDKAARGCGFEVLGHQLRFEGVCRACQKADGPREKRKGR
ncbi:MAG: transcriptional repressor [Phycisphaerae bacterium]